MYYIISNTIGKEFNNISLTMISIFAMLIIVNVNILIDGPSIIGEIERIKKWFFIVFHHFGVTITNDGYPSIVFTIILTFGYFIFQYFTCLSIFLGFNEIGYYIHGVNLINKYEDYFKN
ncbi:hypothetical protein H8356DRAFT_1079131 [Neocallimastix lanati (nom. inval.)]|nr:hypothetical protein H8356DRAFT_1079131 [Neocallimastix sp. JGI-2020a]